MCWNKAGGFATRLNRLTHRCSLQARYFGTEPKLVEVGKLAVPTDKQYEAGQLFVHKSLGCRAIVMGSAPVHVHNTSQHQFTKMEQSHVYLAIADTDDYPDCPTFPIYVMHDAVLPFTVTEGGRPMIRHPQFVSLFRLDEFLTDTRIYTGTRELANMVKQHFKSYMLKDVHRWRFAEDVCVTAVPMFERSGREVKSVLGRDRYLWISHMLVENKGPSALTLAEWSVDIRDKDGEGVEKRRTGPGIGSQAMPPNRTLSLASRQGLLHQEVATLATPVGYVSAKYTFSSPFDTDARRSFDICVPPFRLESFQLPGQ